MSERGFRLPENQNNAGIRHVDTTIELQNIATLLSIPELNNYLKSRILKTNVHYFSNEIGGQLWIASLSHGTYGFSNAKIAVNLKEDKFSMIITSYDFDTTLYKKEDFKTYSGTISIYNQKIEMIRENYFKRGRLKQIKVRNGSNFSKIVIHFPPDPGPEPGPGGSNGDWCAVFPPLCDYGGGGGGGNNSGSATSVMMDPGDEGGGGGGGGSYNPFAGEELAPDNYIIEHYWEDPAYDDNEYINPIVWIPTYDQEGYRKNGPVYNYSGGSVQNYTNGVGGKYAIFTKDDGEKIKFPGATITDFGTLQGRGATTSNGGIHADLTFSLKYLQHEYGHYLQAKYYGSDWYNMIILPASFWNMATSPSTHKSFWTETEANQFAITFFGDNSDIALDPDEFPR